MNLETVPSIAAQNINRCLYYRVDDAIIAGSTGLGAAELSKIAGSTETRSVATPRFDPVCCLDEYKELTLQQVWADSDKGNFRQDLADFNAMLDREEKACQEDMLAAAKHRDETIFRMLARMQQKISEEQAKKFESLQQPWWMRI